MRLCDKDIKKWLNEKKLIITPNPSNESINGVTIDIHLGNKFRVFYDHIVSCIDLSNSQKNNELYLKNIMSKEKFFSKENPFFLKPQSLALFTTLESVNMPDNLVGWLDGRSSLARLGLMIHMTSHRVDPGWVGNIVLEIFNAGRLTLMLTPGVKIAALSFELLSQPVMYPYYSRHQAKYKSQNSVIPSRIYKE